MHCLWINFQTLHTPAMPHSPAHLQLACDSNVTRSSLPNLTCHRGVVPACRHMPVKPSSSSASTMAAQGASRWWNWRAAVACMPVPTTGAPTRCWWSAKCRCPTTAPTSIPESRGSMRHGLAAVLPMAMSMCHESCVCSRLTFSRLCHSRLPACSQQPGMALTRRLPCRLAGINPYFFSFPCLCLCRSLQAC